LSKGMSKQYRSSISDFTKVIEINPNYSDGHYNRGLSKIYLDQINSGCLDLSKAGELGHPRAYDMIRKYCN